MLHKAQAQLEKAREYCQDQNQETPNWKILDDVALAGRMCRKLDGEALGLYFERRLTHFADALKAVLFPKPEQKERK